MYEIIFYQRINGETPVLDYMRALRDSGSKDSRIKLNKIAQYLKVLEEKGTRAGKPFVDHPDGEIWGLRPLRDIILFAAVVDGGFVLLHYFMKDTPKTPPQEIKQAKRELADYLKRGVD